MVFLHHQVPLIMVDSQFPQKPKLYSTLGYLVVFYLLQFQINYAELHFDSLIYVLFPSMFQHRNMQSSILTPSI